MGIREVLTAPRSPWQNPCAERLVGSIRRECLDHVIVFNSRHLRRVPKSYFVITIVRGLTLDWAWIHRNHEKHNPAHLEP